ncbi:MAG: hypothetical protein KJ749_11645 [Planctomycetes bacterium]|nr:hypothetical protein [Planctomycetota bacterium]
MNVAVLGASANPLRYSHKAVALLPAAMGGRPDHLLGNVALVARRPGQVAIWHDGGTLVALGPGHEARLDGAIGSVVSLLQWGDEKPCIYTRGLKYFLHGPPLRNATHGMSNEMVERPAYVRIKAGVLLLWVSSGGVDTGENAGNGCGL